MKLAQAQTMVRECVLLLTLFTGLSAAAGDKNDMSNVYQPVGAPADPKVPVQWNRYHDYGEITKLLHAMAAAHPERAKLRSLGKSVGGREMWLFTITSFAKGDDRSKPAFWIDGAIHANEIQGVQVALYTAWYLLEMYGRLPFITRLVDERTFYILPMMSPDSRDAHMHGPASTSSPRSGQLPIDDDRDGLVDEDGPDDIDGDGNIAQMRVRDPNGRWKQHPQYPELLIPCEPDEPGQYRLLGTEGLDNDGDGKVDEDGPGTYDPNRDWPWDWQPRYVQSGALRYPFSAPENRAVADFVIAHANIAGAQSYHNTGGYVLRGPGTKDDVYDAADIAVYDALGKKGELILPNYRYVSVVEGLYPVYGGELNWFYSMRGAMTFLNELFTSFNYFRKPTERGSSDRLVEQRAFEKYLLFGQGLVPWKEVNHPQYGKVEIGGLTKNWGRQPPSFLLEEECHRNMAFTFYHADQMPKVEVQSIDVQVLPGDLRQVTAVIANGKVIPTHTAVDVKRHISPPDVVSIGGKKISVAAGMYDDDPFFLRAKEQKKNPSQMRIPTIPGMGAVCVRWLVSGAGPYTVRVESPKGGSAQRVSKQ